MNIGPIGGGNWYQAKGGGSAKSPEEASPRPDEALTTEPGGTVDAPTDPNVARRQFTMAVNREIGGMIRDIIERQNIRGGSNSAGNIPMDMNVVVTRNGEGEVTVNFSELELPEGISRARITSMLVRLATAPGTALCLDQTVTIRINR